jgi:hypothetical protein
MTWTKSHRKRAAIARSLNAHRRKYWGPFVWAVVVLPESGEGRAYAGNHPWCEHNLPIFKRVNPGCQVTMERLHPEGPIRRKRPTGPGEGT